MAETCKDPLHFLVDRLCCRVYLDGAGNVCLGFSRRHGLAEMMTAQGIAKSNDRVLRDQLRRKASTSGRGSDESSLSVQVVNGAYCTIA